MPPHVVTSPDSEPMAANAEETLPPPHNHPTPHERLLDPPYSPDVDRPLRAYSLLASCYGSAVVAMTLYRRSRRLSLPERLHAVDFVLLSVGVFRASRLLTKDSVTSFVRAPFTEFQGSIGAGEVEEAPVGTGLRHALGELLTCPFCVSMWLATTGTFGMVTFPRHARIVCTVLAALAAADALQFAHAGLERLDSK